METELTCKHCGQADPPGEGLVNVKDGSRFCGWPCYGMWSHGQIKSITAERDELIKQHNENAKHIAKIEEENWGQKEQIDTAFAALKAIVNPVFDGDVFRIAREVLAKLEGGEDGQD